MEVSLDEVVAIQVFRPTYGEFKNFAKYVQYMESQGAHEAGIAKVIPPSQWVPRTNSYDVDNIGIATFAPVCQVVSGKHGLYNQINIKKNSMTLKEYKNLATSERYNTPKYIDYEDLERQHWDNMTFVAPIHGIDVAGSLFDADVEVWNINRLDTEVNYVKEEYQETTDYGNNANLTFGMWKTTSAWHTEDMDLYSINYLHFGAPKTWYAISPQHAERFEKVVKKNFPAIGKCPAFLRHKTLLLSPEALDEQSIPFDKITQEPGEFIITFPQGYHASFSHGFNCTESTNFATPRWIEYGKKAVRCKCGKSKEKSYIQKFSTLIDHLCLQGKQKSSQHSIQTRVKTKTEKYDNDLDDEIVCELTIDHVPIVKEEFPVTNELLTKKTLNAKQYTIKKIKTEPTEMEAVTVDPLKREPFDAGESSEKKIKELIAYFSQDPIQFLHQRPGEIVEIGKSRKFYMRKRRLEKKANQNKVMLPKVKRRKRNDNFYCPNCDREYQQENLVRYHIQYFCGKGARFACAYCTYKAKANSSIRYHIRQEHPTMLFRSIDLTKPAASPEQENLTNATKLLEERELMGKSTLPGQSESNDNYSEDLKYYCNNCNRGFSDRKGIVKHVKRVCCVKMRFGCLYCKYQTKEGFMVSEHVRKYHAGRDVCYIKFRDT